MSLATNLSPEHVAPAARTVRVTEERLPAGVPVRVDRAAGRVIVRTDPGQSPPMGRRDRETAARLMPALAPLAAELGAVYARTEAGVR